MKSIKSILKYALVAMVAVSSSFSSLLGIAGFAVGMSRAKSVSGEKETTQEQVASLNETSEKVAGKLEQMSGGAGAVAQAEMEADLSKLVEEMMKAIIYDSNFEISDISNAEAEIEAATLVYIQNKTSEIMEEITGSVYSYSSCKTYDALKTKVKQDLLIYINSEKINIQDRSVLESQVTTQTITEIATIVANIFGDVNLIAAVRSGGASQETIKNIATDVASQNVANILNGNLGTSLTAAQAVSKEQVNATLTSQTLTKLNTTLGSITNRTLSGASAVSSLNSSSVFSVLNGFYGANTFKTQSRETWKTQFASKANWSDHQVAPTGSGTAASPYLITQGGHLAWLATLSESSTPSDIYARISGVSKINMSNYVWDKPITVRTNFTFDGSNSVIHNLFGNVGLFQTYKRGTSELNLSNLIIASGSLPNVVDNYTTVTQHYRRPATLNITNCLAVLDYASSEILPTSNKDNGNATFVNTTDENDQITMQNCVALGSQNWTNASDGDGIGIGGLIGALRTQSSASLTNCFNFVNVSTATNVGGMIAMTGGSCSFELNNCYNFGNLSSNGRLGGLVGYSGTRSVGVTIKNCGNFGAIIASGNDYIGATGGVVGKFGDSPEASITLENLFNVGDLVATHRIGGIVGSFNDIKNVKINKAINTGDIEIVAGGYGQIAGIVGFLGNCDDVEVLNVLNYGDVLGLGSSAGIIGHQSGSSISRDYGNAVLNNGYNLGDITGSDRVGGVLGQTANRHGISITNCGNFGNVTNNATGTNQATGGIAGHFSGEHKSNYGGAIVFENNVNIGNVQSATSRVGGLVGYSAWWNDIHIINSLNTGDILGGSTDNGYVGGILGYATKGTNTKFTNVVNNGDLITRNHHVAGIIPFVGEEASLELTNVVNTGDMDGSEGYNNANGVAGGLVGSTERKVNVKIKSSYNTGSIKYGDYVGGIIGIMNPNGELQIDSCVNMGEVSLYYCENGAGFVAYSASKLTITNSYNLGTIYGCEHVGGFVGDLDEGWVWNINSDNNVQNYNANISACTNLGDIVLGNGSADHGSCSRGYSGGFIGYIDLDNNTGTNGGGNYNINISGSVNYGNISHYSGENCSYALGGFIGSAWATEDGESKITINDSINAGNITAAYNVAGIIGYINNEFKFDIENCQNAGEIIGDNCAGGIIGYADLNGPKDASEINGYDFRGNGTHTFSKDATLKLQKVNEILAEANEKVADVQAAVPVTPESPTVPTTEEINAQVDATVNAKLSEINTTLASIPTKAAVDAQALAEAVAQTQTTLRTIFNDNSITLSGVTKENFKTKVRDAIIAQYSSKAGFFTEDFREKTQSEWTTAFSGKTAWSSLFTTSTYTSSAYNFIANKTAAELGTKAAPYLISSAEELAWFSFACNQSDSAISGKYFKLDVANKILDLSAHTWTPISWTNTSTVAPRGFDGGNVAIVNSYISDYGAGFFGTIYGSFEIKNMILASGYSYSGGIIKEINLNIAQPGEDSAVYASAENCVNMATIGSEYEGIADGTAAIVGKIAFSSSSAREIISNVKNNINTGNMAGDAYYGCIGVGGILGYNSFLPNNINTRITQTIEACLNFGDIEAYSGDSTNEGVGGVIGYNLISNRGVFSQNVLNCLNAASVGCYSGGIIGMNRIENYISLEQNIESCVNIGYVYNYSENAGGIIAYNDLFDGSSDSIMVQTVSDCINSGDVNSSGNIAGGVIGYNELSYGSADSTIEQIISDCVNAGAISGLQRIGGIIGRNELNYCLVKNETIPQTIINCTNTGVIQGTSSTSKDIGGIIGYNFLTNDRYDGIVSQVIEFCNNTGAISGSRNIGGIIGYNYLQNLVNNATITQTINGCVNTGAVAGLNYQIGGIIGQNYLYNGQSNVSITQNITNCINTGVIQGMTNSNGMAGGIIGCNYYYDNGTNITLTQTITNCINTGDVAGSQYGIGGIIGYNYLQNYVNNASITQNITNCINTGVIRGAVNTSYQIGGIIGYNHLHKGQSNASITQNITNCINTGDVAGLQRIGGIIGYNYLQNLVNNATITQNITNCINTGVIRGTSESAHRAGGIIGENYLSNNVTLNQTLNGCINTGDVAGSQYNIGGIIGYNYLRNDRQQIAQKITQTITNCKNTGAVSGKITGSGQSYSIGGIIGCNYLQNLVNNATITQTINGCVNTGAVAGLSYQIGGIIGQNYLYNGQSNASITQNITNCINTGVIRGTANTSEQIGGIIGYNFLQNNLYSGQSINQTVSGCTNTGAISSNAGYVGGIVGKNYVKFFTGSTTITQNFSNCTNTGEINCNDSNYAGGIVGYSEYDSNYATTTLNLGITNCTNTGNIILCGYASGGIVGYQYVYFGSGAINSRVTQNVTGNLNTGEITGQDSIAGIIGYSYFDISAQGVTATQNISGCCNKGSVTSTSSEFGGLFGRIGLGNNANSVITQNVSNCSNEAAVTTIGYNYNIGGVVGYISLYTYNLATINQTFDNIINTGNILGECAQVGGIIGCMDAYNGNGSINQTISNSVNKGNISGEGAQAGGIVGYNYLYNNAQNKLIKQIIENCINTGNVSKNDTYVGGIIGWNGLGSNASNTYIVQQINGCKNSGELYAKNGYVGGAIGYFEKSHGSYIPIAFLVDGFVNAGSMSVGSGNLGGFFGFLSHEISNWWGGISIINVYYKTGVWRSENYEENWGDVLTGYAYSVLFNNFGYQANKLINCINYANISSVYAGDFIGGIIGEGWNVENLIVNNCINSGSIDASDKNDVSYGGCETAGIVGYVTGAGIVNMNACVNLGTISGGNVAGVLDEVDFDQDYESYLTNTLNLGDVIAPDDSWECAGIGRYINDVSFENVINFGDVYGYSGGILAGFYQEKWLSQDGSPYENTYMKNAINVGNIYNNRDDDCDGCTAPIYLGYSDALQLENIINVGNQILENNHSCQHFLGGTYFGVIKNVLNLGTLQGGEGACNYLIENAEYCFVENILNLGEITGENLCCYKIINDIDSSEEDPAVIKNIVNFGDFNIGAGGEGACLVNTSSEATVENVVNFGDFNIINTECEWSTTFGNGISFGIVTLGGVNNSINNVVNAGNITVNVTNAKIGATGSVMVAPVVCKWYCGDSEEQNVISNITNYGDITVNTNVKFDNLFVGMIHSSNMKEEYVRNSVHTLTNCANYGKYYYNHLENESYKPVLDVNPNTTYNNCYNASFGEAGTVASFTPEYKFVEFLRGEKVSRALVKNGGALKLMSRWFDGEGADASLYVAGEYAFNSLPEHLVLYKDISDVEFVLESSNTQKIENEIVFTQGAIPGTFVGFEMLNPEANVWEMVGYSTNAVAGVYRLALPTKDDGASFEKFFAKFTDVNNQIHVRTKLEEGVFGALSVSSITNFATTQETTIEGISLGGVAIGSAGAFTTAIANGTIVKLGFAKLQNRSFTGVMIGTTWLEDGTVNVGGTEFKLTRQNKNGEVTYIVSFTMGVNPISVQAIYEADSFQFNVVSVDSEGARVQSGEFFADDENAATFASKLEFENVQIGETVDVYMNNATKRNVKEFKFSDGTSLGKPDVVSVKVSEGLLNKYSEDGVVSLYATVYRTYAYDVSLDKSGVGADAFKSTTLTTSYLENEGAETSPVDVTSANVLEQTRVSVNLSKYKLAYRLFYQINEDEKVAIQLNETSVESGTGDYASFQFYIEPAQLQVDESEFNVRISAETIVADVDYKNISGEGTSLDNYVTTAVEIQKMVDGDWVRADSISYNDQVKLVLAHAPAGYRVSSIGVKNVKTGAIDQIELDKAQTVKWTTANNFKLGNYLTADSKIEIVTTYLKQYDLNIGLLTGKNQGNFELYINGQKTSSGLDAFDIGSEVEIKFIPNKYYKLSAVNGVRSENISGNSVAFTLNGNRNISAEFEKVEYGFKINDASKNGTVSTLNKTIKLGDTVILNLNTKAINEMKNWTVGNLDIRKLEGVVIDGNTVKFVATQQFMDMLEIDGNTAMISTSATAGMKSSYVAIGSGAIAFVVISTALAIVLTILARKAKARRKEAERKLQELRIRFNISDVISDLKSGKNKI